MADEAKALVAAELPYQETKGRLFEVDVLVSVLSFLSPQSF